MPPRRRKRKDKNRTKKILLGALTIFILFGSTIGLVFSSINKGGLSSTGTQKVRHGDYTFTYQNRGTGARWEVKVGRERFIVFYPPRELIDIDYDSAITTILQTPIFYATMEPPNATTDPLEEAMGFMLYRFQQDFPRHDIYVASALSSPPTNDSLPGLEEWEVKDCTDATETVPVVMLKKAENISVNSSLTLSDWDLYHRRITLEGNCIIIEADQPGDFMRLYDRMLLGFLGVMV